MTGKQFDHLNRPREIGDRVMGAEEAPDGVKGCKGTVIGRTRCRIERDRWYWRVKWDHRKTPSEVYPDFLVRHLLH